MPVVTLVLIHEALLTQSTSTLAFATPNPSNFDTATTLAGLAIARFVLGGLQTIHLRRLI